MNTPNAKDDVRAYVLHTTTPALPAVSKALCSAQINFGITSRLPKASAHDYQPA